MPNYFEVMGIPLVRGRVLEDRDEGSSLNPVLINQGFAQRFWPGSDPIGKRFKVGPRDRAHWQTIVGVVGDVRQIGLDSPAPFRPINFWHPIRTRDSSWQCAPLAMPAVS